MRISLNPRAAIAALAVTVAAATASAADETFVVIKAGTVIPVSGDPIPRGEIVIVDGTIRLVGVGLEYPADATVIDARDQTVMPGFVHPGSRHGLPSRSRGGINGNIRVADEADLEAIDFDPLIAAGYTSVALYADGSGIPGVTSVFRTAAPEGLDEFSSRGQLLLGDSYLRIGMRNVGGDKARFRGALTKAKAEIAKIEKARGEWEKKKAEFEAKQKAEAEKAAKAKAEAEKKGAAADEPAKKDDEKKDEGPGEFKPPATDRTHQPLMDWIEGKLAVNPVIELGTSSGLLHLQDVMKAHEDLDATLMFVNGFGADYNHVAEMVVEHVGDDGIVVTTLDVGRMPQTSTLYNFAGVLARHGVELAVNPESPGGGGGGFRGRRGRGGGGPVAVTRANAANAVRSMPSRLAMMVRYGLPRDAAIRALTVNPATVLGIADRVGTIEVNKDADLIFLDGDAIDPLTQVTRVMILGETVWEMDEESGR
ncbi:MAG: amidohydrolase family protein [Phycisphaerales bacterium]